MGVGILGKGLWDPILYYAEERYAFFLGMCILSLENGGCVIIICSYTLLVWLLCLNPTKEDKAGDQEQIHCIALYLSARIHMRQALLGCQNWV